MQARGTRISREAGGVCLAEVDAVQYPLLRRVHVHLYRITVDSMAGARNIFIDKTVDVTVWDFRSGVEQGPSINPKP
jgi:hypothetical protein